MSKQIKRLMGKHPQVFYDVSYEGNGYNSYGDTLGDGTWLYMNPGWYCASSDTGTIHEWTVKDVLECAKRIYQDKERWISENDEPIEHAKIRAGDYDR